MKERKLVSMRLPSSSTDRLRLFRGKKPHKGAAMILLFVVMMVLSVMAIALLSLTQHSLHLCDKQQRNALAFNVAESGVECGIRWLRDQSTLFKPSVNSSF